MKTLSPPPIVGVDPARIELDVVPPLDWILVRLDPPITETDGGIAVPAQSVPPARTGVVVSIGPGMVSEDGRTRLPMHCAPGQRVMFERAAGKGLPRCPRETSERRGWAYLLLRDGSLNAIVEAWDDPADPKALDAGAAGLPARPEGSSIPVTRAGRLSPERLRPVQDWMVVRADAKPEMADASPLPSPPASDDLARPAKLLHLPGRNGKGQAKRVEPKRVHLQETEPAETYEMWSGTVLSRGDGLMAVTRCLDGDRVGTAPRLVEVGDRCLFAVARPFCEQIDPIRAFRPGSEFLMREYGQGGASNVVGKLPAVALTEAG